MYMCARICVYVDLHTTLHVKGQLWVLVLLPFILILRFILDLCVCVYSYVCMCTMCVQVHEEARRGGMRSPGAHVITFMSLCCAWNWTHPVEKQQHALLTAEPSLLTLTSISLATWSLVVYYCIYLACWPTALGDFPVSASYIQEGALGL